VSDYVTYLRKYADDNKIYPVRREVSRVEWNGTSFEVTFTDDVSKYNYEFVVICTGSFDKPNLPTIPGLNDGISAETKTISFSHACSWIGPEQFASSRLLIFGGGMTAIELAEECVRFGIRPFLSFRAGRGKTFPHQIFGIDPRFLVYPIMRRIPIKVFHRQCTKGWAYRGIDRGFKEFCSQGLIDVRPLIKSVSGPLVTFTDHSSAEVDHVVFATGYRWDMPFLPSSIPTAMQGNPILKRGESIACPGLFCVGVTCAFNASSHFIHGVLEDAKRVASLIAERKTTAFPTHQR
jgi:putative flavoprotein involved in K+ transport